MEPQENMWTPEDVEKFHDEQMRRRRVFGITLSIDGKDYMPTSELEQSAEEAGTAARLGDSG